MLLPTVLLASALLPQEISGGWESRLSIPGDEHLGYFGSETCCPGDLDRDGIPDWLIVRNGKVERAALFALSGEDGSLLYEVDLGGGYRDYVVDLTALDDVDRDGVVDYAIGQYLAGARGRVYLISGATGDGIARLDGEPGATGFGYQIGSIQDLDGDGLRELLVGAPARAVAGIHGAGTIYIYSGATRAEIARIEGDASTPYFGLSFQSIADLDGDQVEDLAVGVSGSRSASGGRVEIYSGAARALVRTLTPPNAADFHAVWQVICPGDLTGDSTADLVVAAISQRSHYNPMIVHAFSGADGALIYELDDHFLHSAQLAGIGDTDGDGAADFVCGSYTSWKSGWGMVSFLSGASGTLLFQQSGHPDSRLGSSLSVATEPDAAGRYEILVTAPTRHFGPGRDQLGAAHVLTFQPFVTSSKTEVSASAGATVSVDLNFPDRSGGWQYRLLASLSGKGLSAIRDLRIPISRDALVERTFRGNYPEAATGRHHGILDAEGRAAATLDFSPGAWLPLVGRTLHVAAIAGPVTKSFSLSSRATAITILP